MSLETRPPHANLTPDSAIRRRFDETDWAATALGPLEHWPQSLRIAVSICLNSRFPMFVWWGPQLVNIYNDAYVPILGKRHPSAFARPARESWNDIWDVLGPQADAVMLRGESSWNERVLLVMERNGYPEDTYFTWSYSPILDDDGSIGGLFCACTEETARVAAERERDQLVREAQDAARKLRTWFDNAPGFVALLRGPEMVFEMVNEAYYQLVGHRKLEGLPAMQALPEVRSQGFDVLLRNVYETGQPFTGRAVRVLLQRAPDGPAIERFVDLLYQPVLDADARVVGIFAQGHDVTEQVRAVDALKEADRRKDEFLATLAHELRNPIAPIRQAASLAKMPGLDAKRKAWALDVIERQASHMALLLDDLLDVSRISRGRFELRLQPVELREVVDAATETARPVLDRKKHQLVVRLPEHPVRLQADPIRLAQVLSNLLSNAAKYTDEGGRIELSAATEEGEIVIRVRDNGIGLAPGATGLIFEMFSQVSPALDRGEGGLGIGLALSRGLVALHGGRVEAFSPGLGQGSEFVVTLPWRQAEEAAIAQPAAAAATGARTILIADDNLDALHSMAALLEMDGHQVLTAENGHQALELAQQASPQVVILDIGMPGLSGYEVASRIRAQPWGREMRLVALTGWGQAEDIAQAHKSGFDHHVTKPVDVARLASLIDAAPAGPRTESSPRT